MSNNKRWGSEDKIELMKLYSKGHSYDDISKVLDRSPLAIKLRLESIVYDNLTKGKSLELLTRMFNTDPDTIKQFYYSHKSFKEGRGEQVKNVEFHSDEFVNNYKSTNEHINEHTNEYINEHINEQLGGNSSDKHRIVANKKKSATNIVNTKENSIDRIEQENQILEGIINNYRMHRQVRKLYIDGKLDKQNVVVYENLMKKTKDSK